MIYLSYSHYFVFFLDNGGTINFSRVGVTYPI